MRYVIPHPAPRSVGEGGWGRVGRHGARSGATWWIWSLSAGPHFCALEALSDRPGVRLARLGRVPQRWLAGCILAVRPCHVISCIHPSIRPSIHSSLLSLRPHQHPLSPSGTSHPTLSVSLLLISACLHPRAMPPAPPSQREATTSGHPSHPHQHAQPSTAAAASSVSKLQSCRACQQRKRKVSLRPLLLSLHLPAFTDKCSATESNRNAACARSEELNVYSA